MENDEPGNDRPDESAYVAAAQKLYGRDTVEIDQDGGGMATLSVTDDGAWVRAWVYVTDTQAGE